MNIKLSARGVKKGGTLIAFATNLGAALEAWVGLFSICRFRVCLKCKKNNKVCLFV